MAAPTPGWPFSLDPASAYVPLLLWPAGHTGRLLRALLATSILFLLAHLVFQICLHTATGLDQLLGHNCECHGPASLCGSCWQG